MFQILHNCEIPNKMNLSNDHFQTFSYSLVSAVLTFSNLIFSLGAITQLFYHGLLYPGWYQVFTVCGHFLWQTCLMLISLVEVWTQVLCFKNWQRQNVCTLESEKDNMNSSLTQQWSLILFHEIFFNKLFFDTLHPSRKGSGIVNFILLTRCWH